MTESTNLPARRDADEDVDALPMLGSNVALGLLRSRLPAFETSIDTSTLEGKAKVAALRLGRHEALSDHVNKEIEITDVLGHVVGIVNADGVEVPSPRIVLVCRDGATYQAVSSGVLDSLKVLVELFGPPSWPDGIRVTVTQPQTRSKFRTLVLVPVFAGTAGTEAKPARAPRA